MAYDAFLKLDQIPGDVTQKGFEGHIKVQAFDWTLDRPEGSGSSVGALVPGDFTFVADTGQQTPRLLQAMVTNQTISTGTLRLMEDTFFNGGTASVLYVMVDLANCTVSSLRTSHPGDPSAPHTDSFTLRFGKLTVTRVTGGITSTYTRPA
jgi:type VI secretion system Hcp family effector